MPLAVFQAIELIMTKSEALPLGNFGDKSALDNFPFKWSESGFTYLGVKTSANLKIHLRGLTSLLPGWVESV